MTIGNQLKKARQKKQVTLNEVYHQTRIHPNVLSALEEDRFDKILNPAYIRSFLKGYTTYLGLDAKRILAEYDRLHPGEKLEITELPSTKKRFSLPEFDLAKIRKPVNIIAASTLAIIILIFLVRGTAKVINNISQKRALRAKQIDLTKTTKPIKTIETKKRIGKKEVQKAPQKIVSKPISRPSGKVSIPAGEKLRLTITATDDVWIQLKVDGKIIFQNVLKKGSSEQWMADNDFTIWTGRAQAMQLNLNGNDLGTPGEGVKKDIIVTREGIRK